jgi:hypothetical protein
MTNMTIAAVSALAITLGAAMTGNVAAQEVKVGIVLPYTGGLAEDSEQIDRGIDSYLKLNADQVKPYTIKLIKRDSKARTAPKPRSRFRSC